MKMPVFYERFDKECMEVPIFKYCDPYQIFQRISCASNEDIVTIKESLITRAKKNHDIVKEELTNMYKLCNIIDDYVSDKKITIKIVVLTEFSKELKRELDKYNDEENVKDEEM